RGLAQTEAAARTARLAFFREHGDTVLLGHTADDQAETVVMHLLRGSGSFAGVRPMSCVDGLRILRPLLGFRRADLRAYCDRRGLQYLDDPSNRDPRFRRNRVRAELLPLMEDIAPGATVAITRLAEVAAADLDAIEHVIDRLPIGSDLDRAHFRAQPIGI